MTDVKAKLNYYRVAPRKVRLVADLIRGKSIEAALIQLNLLRKKASPEILKLLKSAISNAKNNHKVDLEKSNLYIKEIRVDEGPSLKRFKPVSRGSAHGFKRRSSHISVVISDKVAKVGPPRSAQGPTLRKLK